MKLQYYAEIMRAYLTKEHDIATLDRIHDRFADGSNVRFLHHDFELFIHDEPKFYRKKAEDIRRHLDETGYHEDFIVIEDNYNETKAVWYVQGYLDEDRFSSCQDEDDKHRNEGEITSSSSDDKRKFAAFSFVTN